MVGPSSTCEDEPVAADAGEPEAALGVRRDRRGQGDGVPREILLLELERYTAFGLFSAPGGFEPGAEVFARRRVDLQHAEGRARDRLPLQVDDLAGDRHVVFTSRSVRSFRLRPSHRTCTQPGPWLAAAAATTVH